MNSEFLFPLFPEGGLAGSLITSVAIGIFVSAFFNLRFGWVLSGFIIPGYLVPLMIHKPIVACIDIIEGICAYFLTYFSSRVYASYRHTSTFFGKDGFYATFITSVFVRVFFSFFLLPTLFVWASSKYGILISYEDHFQSFGIIIIALIANQFWVPGFQKGFTPFLVILIVTYIIIRFGLIEWTNFRISEISYIYDADYYSLFGSYKSYVILLITALISTRMNFKYGWPYGGILVASLLALQWYAPVSVIFTLLEALAIYFIATYVLRISSLRTANIERAREIILFFTIGYAYKICLSWIMFIFLPGVKITDLYGFGYLLSTLIAIKMYNSHMPIRVMSAVVQTSVFGVVLGTIIAFILTLVPRVDNLFPEKSDMSFLLKGPEYELAKQPRPIKVAQREGFLTDFILERRQSFAKKGTNLYKAPAERELYQFDKQLLAPLIESIKKGAYKKDLQKLNGIARLFGYELLLFKEQDKAYIILAERLGGEKRKYQPTFIFNVQKASSFIFQSPYPLKYQNVTLAGLYLFKQMNGFAYIFSEADPEANLDRTSNLLMRDNKNSYFHVGAQAILRDSGDQPYMLVALRGFSGLSPVDPFKGSASEADVFLSFSNGAIRPNQFTDLQKVLISTLKGINSGSFT